jgi:hypothetical protein
VKTVNEVGDKLFVRNLAVSFLSVHSTDTNKAL